MHECDQNGDEEDQCDHHVQERIYNILFKKLKFLSTFCADICVPFEIIKNKIQQQMQFANLFSQKHKLAYLWTDMHAQTSFVYNHGGKLKLLIEKFNIDNLNIYHWLLTAWPVR